MAIHSDGSVQGAGDANRRLVRFFSICLSSLVFVYSLLAVRIFVEGHAFAFTDWVLVAAKVALGAAALLVLSIRPGSRSGWSARSTRWARCSRAPMPMPRPPKKSA